MRDSRALFVRLGLAPRPLRFVLALMTGARERRRPWLVKIHIRTGLFHPVAEYLLFVAAPDLCIVESVHASSVRGMAGTGYRVSGGFAADVRVELLGYPSS